MNLIHFHTHDSGRYFRHYGCADAPTQAISTWAEERAVSFRNAFTPAPTCSPSRAALLTGTYPHSCGMLGLAHRGFRLRDCRRHLALFLASRGWHTVLAGVQHEAAGCFDHALGAAQLGYREDITADLESISPFREEPGPGESARMGEERCGGERSSRREGGQTQGDRTAAWDRENTLRAAEWLHGRRGDTPFFLSLGMFASHREYPSAATPAPDLLPPFPGLEDTPETRADHARFLTSLRQADENFRIMQEALAVCALADTTAVLVTTDHGLALPFHKCNLNGAGTGVILSLTVPGIEPVSPFSDALVSTVDLFPTLCELFGLPIPPQTAGRSFAACLADPEREHRDFVYGEVNFHTSYEPMRSVRSRRFSYIRRYDSSYPKVHLSNIDNSPAKERLVSRGLAERAVPMRELYDLTADPLETMNLAEDARYAAVVSEMERLLAGWQLRHADPLLHGPISPPPGTVVNRPECREPDSGNPEDYLP